MKTVLVKLFFGHSEKFQKAKIFQHDLKLAQNLMLNTFSLHTEVAKTNRFRVITIFLDPTSAQKKADFLHSRCHPENFFDIKF